MKMINGVGHALTKEGDRAVAHLTERFVHRIGGHAVRHGEGAALTAVVDDSAAGGLHSKGGDHGGHVSLGDENAVEGADQSAGNQAEQEHNPNAARGVEHLDAKAGEERNLRAYGNINLTSADDHGHAQRDDTRGGSGLTEQGGNVAPAEKVGVDDDGDDQNQNEGNQIAVVREQAAHKRLAGQLLLAFLGVLHSVYSPFSSE